MTALQTATLPTPAGLLAVVVDPDTGAVLASGFGTVIDMLARLTQQQQARGAQDAPTSAVLAPIVAAVAAYTAGDLQALDGVAVSQPGGEFLQAAWRALREIPAGHTASYTELAARAGRPAAVRAAGSACARNLVAPFVPCHRVLRSDGTLGGYEYGLPVKAALLRHEHALADHQDALFGAQ